MKISNIGIHHAGGLRDEPFASTAHLTAKNVSSAHYGRWNGYAGSKYITDVNLRYGGYTVYYEPTTREFIQMRAIGEETIAIKGYNFNTFQLCIGGNYNRLPLSNPSAPVDPLTDQIKEDVILFLHDLINGNKRDLVVVPGTVIDLSISRVWPHSFFSRTECYGSFITEKLFRNLLIAYKPKQPEPAYREQITNEELLELRSVLMEIILQLWTQVLDIQKRLQARGVALGAVDDKECPGTI